MSNEDVLISFGREAGGGGLGVELMSAATVTSSDLGLRAEGALDAEKLKTAVVVEAGSCRGGGVGVRLLVEVDIIVIHRLAVTVQLRAGVTEVRSGITEAKAVVIEVRSGSQRLRQGS